MVNLIQNYIHPKNNYVPPSKKEVPEFDINKELANKTFIKPLPGKGKLVKNRIFDAPAIMVKDFIYDINALKHGLNGEANDHQLGKLNDVGMKLGGLTIAGYLFTRRGTPLPKAMEFVGLASFFASMAIWPKLAIQLPARIIHGVNVQQKYEDQYGRKKLFYQDPQFIPWDLYSDKEIHKIGNRLGVPKNIPNRREVIQEKMKKIALQSNTLWMLTAGFATPVMSALICNQLEKPIANLQNNYRNKKMDNLLANFDQSVKNADNHSTINAVNKLISISRNQSLTPALIHDISSAITSGLDINTSEIFEGCLKNVIGTGTYQINNSVANKVVKRMNKALEGVFDEDVLKKILPTPNQLIDYFNDNGNFEHDYTKSEIRNLITDLNTQIETKLDDIAPDLGITKRKARKLLKDNLTNIEPKKNPIFQALLSAPYSKLDAKTEKLIKAYAEAISEYKAKISVLDKYQLVKTGSAPETIGANHFNKTNEILIDALKITPQEIENTRIDDELSAQLIRTHIEDMVNTKDYENLLNKMASQIADLENQIKPSDLSENIYRNAEISEYEKLCNETFNILSEKVRKLVPEGSLEMEDFIDRLIGPKANSENFRRSNGSLKELQISLAKDRLINLKSTYFRTLNSFILFKTLGKTPDKVLFNFPKEIPRELKEEISELSKQIAIHGDVSDILTKMYMLRNPALNAHDLEAVEIVNGKQVYKYLKPNETLGKVDMPQDQRTFIGVMKLLYETPLDDETLAILKKYPTVFEQYKKYRETVFVKLGNAEYFDKLHHMAVAGKGKVDSTPEFRYNIMGLAPSKMINNASKMKYNTRKWLKMFGAFGAGLLGITVVSQLFFGKIKYPKEITSKKDNLK